MLWFQNQQVSIPQCLSVFLQLKGATSWFLNAYPTDSYGFKINLHTPYLNNIVHLYFLNTDLDCYIWAAENVIHNSTLFVGNKMDLSAFE